MNLDWSVIWEYRGAFAVGVLNTVLLTVLTMMISIPGGLFIMALRISRFSFLRTSGLVYVEIFRGTPLILLIYWTFYVLPVLTGFHLPPFATGLLALSLIVSAYNSETFRAGVNSIRKGQWDAARALGMNSSQVMAKVILPQALRRVLPAFANTWVSLFKDTSLISVIAVYELSYAALQVRSQTFRILEVLTALALIYWALGYPQAKLVDWINRRFGVTE